jgi:primosomal protein N' (replication factor Y) (superfamily II helicase)
VRRPVAVAVAVPRLELDRPFTYLVPDGTDAPTGTLVSVPFHGRTVRGWVLGPTDDVPGRVLPVRRVLSRVPLFDDRALRLYRWMAERYVTPLAAVIDRALPPRVAGEEGRPAPPPAAPPPVPGSGPLGAYRQGPRLLASCREGGGAFVVRPLPDDEGGACVEAVAACFSGGRAAVVVVPEVDPLPATAARVLEAFGPAALLFAGGDRRSRYRAWLDVVGGRYRVVVGTGPAVFAPTPGLGLLWVHREAHGGHREERAPHHHVRDVALARARFEDAVCVLGGLVTSGEAAALLEGGGAVAVSAPRSRERAAAPLVETARPDREDRSPRLGAALREARGAVLLISRRGYGVARVCRSCGEPARCGACQGPIVIRDDRPLCAVCGADGVCASCGAQDFGVDRGGAERIAEWAEGVTDLPVEVVAEGGAARPPDPGTIVVGTAAAVKDFGPRRVDLVAVLDADRGRRRPGIRGPEQALATWMEAAVWAGPRADGGRVLVHTQEPGDPAIQALIRWDPSHLHRRERERRSAAGFPPGFPVFRVLGTGAMPEALEALSPSHLLSTSLGDEAVSLVTIRPEEVAAFRAGVLELVGRGVVSRIEAEPQL